MAWLQRPEIGTYTREGNLDGFGAHFEIGVGNVCGGRVERKVDYTTRRLVVMNTQNTRLKRVPNLDHLY